MSEVNNSGLPQYKSMPVVRSTGRFSNDDDAMMIQSEQIEYLIFMFLGALLPSDKVFSTMVFEELDSSTSSGTTVKPPIKDTPKEDKPPSKGQAKIML